ncbi:carboxymuconolactone decarboxylase family protein [Streptomyces sp. NPDC002623]
MATSQDAADFLEQNMRGDVHPGFRALERVDPTYLRAYQEYARVVYGQADSVLPSGMRELIVIALLAGKGDWPQMQLHTRRALLNGDRDQKVGQRRRRAGRASRGAEQGNLPTPAVRGDHGWPRRVDRGALASPTALTWCGTSRGSSSGPHSGATTLSELHVPGKARTASMIRDLNA